MTDNTWGKLWRRAAKLGLRIDQLGGHRSPGLGYAADGELDEREAAIAG